MQTFITSKDPQQIAQHLDNKRLNKQALEAWQIMMTLLKLDPENNLREPKGWYNHPAVKMWSGHETYLLHYITCMTDEWKRRGFKTTIADKAKVTHDYAVSNGLLSGDDSPPMWLSNDTLANIVISSHKKALLVKNYEWYHQFGWEEDVVSYPQEYEYYWPVNL